jgi:hypothetical protein
LNKWKMPPPIKVYEAIGAIGDGRVRAIDDADAPGGWDVGSSDGAKTYRVELSADGREISSNDNASYWHGYLGYPRSRVSWPSAAATSTRLWPRPPRLSTRWPR